jgi:hypothetical protein
VQVAHVNTLHDLTLIAMTVACFIGAESFSIRHYKSHEINILPIKGIPRLFLTNIGPLINITSKLDFKAITEMHLWIPWDLVAKHNLEPLPYIPVMR